MVSLAEPGLTVAGVLDIVANRRLGEVPTTFALCWSAQGKNAAMWRVTDSGPVALQTFCGGALYMLPRKIELHTAFDEWIPSVRTLLLRWGKDKDPAASAVHTVALAEAFSRMNDRVIMRLYETMHKPAPVPLHLSYHLHGFDDCITVQHRETVCKFIPVTNQTLRPLIVFAELSTTFTASDSVQVTVSPRATPIPEGSTRVFKLAFTGTADSTSEKRDNVHSVCFTCAFADPRQK